MPYRDGTGICPRCGAPLHGPWSESEKRLQCAGCGGRFVGYGSLARSHPRLSQQLGISPAPLPQTPLACPHCNLPMRALSVTRITIDFCAAHGVWFDTHELERLAGKL